jgi:hypothetical protein
MFQSGTGLKDQIVTAGTKQLSNNAIQIIQIIQMHQPSHQMLVS